MLNKIFPFGGQSVAASAKGELLNLQQFTKQAAKKQKQSVAGTYLLVKFDIDRFASLDRRYGTARGEQLLGVLTHALAEKSRKGHLLARVEDKFMLLAPNSPDFMQSLQQGLMEAVENIGLEQYVGTVRFSLGAYALNDANEPMQEAIAKVSVAHKTAGKHPYKSVIWYDAGLVQAIAQENYYNEHLLQGIAGGEFKVYLQRQVLLANTSQLRAKALVRWVQPNGRMIYPDSFIPQFEKNGMMVHLDFHMIEQVCAYLQSLCQVQGAEVVVSVNVSPVTLFQPDFMVRFLALVERYCVPAHTLVLEVQHAASVEGDPMVIERLEALREQGFALAAETVTAGHSNLRLMAELPIQYLKIDRHFIRAADMNEKIKVIMAGIIDMAHNLSLQVICEGLEHQTDIALLQGLGCDIAQGYYLMRALPKEDFIQAARDQNAMIQEKCKL